MIEFISNNVLCHFGRSDSIRPLLYKNKPDISNSALNHGDAGRAGLSCIVPGRTLPGDALPNPDISIIIRIIRNIVKELLRR